MERHYCGVCGQQATEPDFGDTHKHGSCERVERRLAEEGLSRRYNGRVRP